MELNLNLKHEAFGIPDERYDEIISAVMDELRRRQTVSQAIENLIGRCGNLNEVIVASFLYGAAVEHLRVMASMLADLFTA